MALLLKQSAVPAGPTWDLTTSVAERVGYRIIGARAKPHFLQVSHGIYL
jgi:hypothetical protein